MSLDAAILRELGATTRTFVTVKGAMLWYRDQAAKRLWRCTILELGSVPRSTEERNITNATYAAIAACLKGIEHVAWLIAWYESTWGDGSWLAEKANLSRWCFTRRCRKTERKIRSRLEYAGIMGEQS